MSRRYILLAVFLLAISFSVGLYLNASGNSRSPTASEDTPANLSSGVRFVPMEEPIGGERVSVREAAARLPYPLPSFGYMPQEGQLSEVWASWVEAPPETRSLAMVFDNGITLIVHQEPFQLNFNSLAEPPFQLVEVNGSPAVGKGPGDQILRGGSPWHYPGSVKWQKGNLVLTVYGEYSLEELIKVAEAVRLES